MASAKGPSRVLKTMVVFGEKGRLIINVKDLSKWKKEGYKTEEEMKKEKKRVMEDTVEVKPRRASKK